MTRSERLARKDRARLEYLVRCARRMKRMFEMLMRPHPEDVRDEAFHVAMPDAHDLEHGFTYGGGEAGQRFISEECPK